MLHGFCSERARPRNLKASGRFEGYGNGGLNATRRYTGRRRERRHDHGRIQGEGGELVSVKMTAADNLRGEAAINRAKALMVQLTKFAEDRDPSQDPESHAASFALIAYASNYIKCHYPDAFCAALINSQPMGFYAPAQIVGDARAHGVEVRPVCINQSRWDCTLEPIGNSDRHAVRLGFRRVKGLAVADAARIVAARMNSAFASVDDMWRRSGVPSEALVQLAKADAFLPSLKLARRDAIWAIKALRDEPLPLFAAAAEREMAQSPSSRSRRSRFGR